MYKKRTTGFTIVELLIVIVVIAILAAVVVVAYSGVQARAKDAGRLQDMASIRKALELYKAQYGVYPGSVSSYGEGTSCGGWDTSRLDSNGDGKPFITPLVTSGILSKVPTDSSDTPGTSCGGYDYFLYSAGSYGCSSSRGAFYVLGVRNMDSTQNPHPSSPGWSCPSRNWQTEFDWVTGGFTN